MNVEQVVCLGVWDVIIHMIQRGYSPARVIQPAMIPYAIQPRSYALARGFVGE